MEQYYRQFIETIKIYKKFEAFDEAMNPLIEYRAYKQNDIYKQINILNKDTGKVIMSFLFAEDEVEDSSKYILLSIYFYMCHNSSIKEKYKIKNYGTSHFGSITLTGNSTAHILHSSFTRPMHYDLRINTINISSEKLDSSYTLRKFGAAQYIFKNESKIPANIILKTEGCSNFNYPIKGCKFIGCFNLISMIDCDLLNIEFDDNAICMHCAIVSDKQNIINEPKMMKISKHDVRCPHDNKSFALFCADIKDNYKNKKQPDFNEWCK